MGTKMIEILCQNKFISTFFIEINEDLVLEKKPQEGHLYINNIRAKALPGGVTYQLIEPELFRNFDEICQLFDFNNVEIDIDKKTFIPLSVKADGKYLFTVEFNSNSVKIATKIGLKELIQVSSKIQSIFNNKIVQVLKEVNLYDN